MAGELQVRRSLLPITSMASMDAVAGAAAEFGRRTVPGNPGEIVALKPTPEQVHAAHGRGLDQYCPYCREMLRQHFAGAAPRGRYGSSGVGTVVGM